MKKRKTTVNVNISPNLDFTFILVEIILLAVLVFSPMLHNYSLEEVRNFSIMFAVFMIALPLIRVLITKVAIFDYRGITFYGYFCIKKIGTISYSDIKKITLITTTMNTVGKARSLYSDIITIYLDADSEKITEYFENVPNGLYWQIVATKHNLAVLERYRKEYFPEIEIEDHRHKTARDLHSDPYYYGKEIKRDKKSKNVKK